MTQITTFPQYKELAPELKAHILGFANPEDYPNIERVDREHRGLVQGAVVGPNYKSFLAKYYVKLSNKFTLKIQRNKFRSMSNANSFPGSERAKKYVSDEILKLDRKLIDNATSNLHCSIVENPRITNNALKRMINIEKDPEFKQVALCLTQAAAEGYKIYSSQWNSQTTQEKFHKIFENAKKITEKDRNSRATASNVDAPSSRHTATQLPQVTTGAYPARSQTVSYRRIFAGAIAAGLSVGIAYYCLPDWNSLSGSADWLGTTICTQMVSLPFFCS